MLKNHVFEVLDDAFLQLWGDNQVNSLQWNPSAQDHVDYSRQPAQRQGGEAFFHPLDCEPTLQIGYECLLKKNYPFLLLFPIH